jgi:SAM-dependent methyltransferase
MTDESIQKAARWGRGWQEQGNWKAHSIDKITAERLADGYFALLAAACNWKPQGSMRGLDIGAGAGYIAAALQRRGIMMVASEWNESGLALIRRENPSVATSLVDLMSFHEPNSWDFILCRELYPFTRTNSFTEQNRIVERLIDSLRPGGAFVLVASDVSHPHCLDQRLLLQVQKRNPKAGKVVTGYLEALACRPGVWVMGKWSYGLLTLFLQPFIWWKKHFRRWVTIYITVIVKSDDTSPLDSTI